MVSKLIKSWATYIYYYCIFIFYLFIGMETLYTISARIPEMIHPFFIQVAVQLSFLLWIWHIGFKLYKEWRKTNE